MLEYTFGIQHEGCWTETVNDAFPDVTATIIYSYHLEGFSITMIEVRNVDNGILDSLVEWLGEHPIMTNAHLTSYFSNERRAFISLEGDYDTDTEPVLNVLLRNKCFPSVPATVRYGVEHWSVIGTSHELVSQAHQELQQLGPVTVDSLTDTGEDYYSHPNMAEIKRALQEMSIRQKEVLAIAIEQGYYDHPRGCNIEEIAEYDSANLSTVGEHLRRSEGKLLKAFESAISTNGQSDLDDSGT